MNFIVDILVGIAVSALGGMGIGGGGLMTLYLILVRGLGQLEAQGINILMFAATGSSAAIINMRSRDIDLHIISIAALLSSVFAAIGASLSLVTDVGVLRVCLGVLLVAAGIITIIPQKKYV